MRISSKSRVRARYYSLNVKTRPNYIERARYVKYAKLFRACHDTPPSQSYFISQNENLVRNSLKIASNVTQEHACIYLHVSLASYNLSYLPDWKWASSSAFMLRAKFRCMHKVNGIGEIACISPSWPNCIPWEWHSTHSTSAFPYWRCDRAETHEATLSNVTITSLGKHEKWGFAKKIQRSISMFH